MTLFSLIALVAIALIWLFALAQNRYFVGEEDIQTVWRSVFVKVVKFFDIQWGSTEKRPFSWRRFGIKLFLVALVVAALYGGFCDCYELAAKNSEAQVLNVIGAIVCLVVTFVIIWGVPMMSYDNNPFTTDYFDINAFCVKREEMLIKTVNIAVACSWVAMFVLLYCIFGDGHVFALIGISAFCAAVADIILALIGAVVYLLGRNLIVWPIVTLIKWLIK